MRILHILDHSIPLQSGYTFRSRAILLEQRKQGMETFHITGPKQALSSVNNVAEEEVEGLLFYRSGAEHGLLAKLPVLNQLSVITVLKQRLRQIIPRIKPDILHAHSPALNGVAMLAIARQFAIPCVYEVRGFWEDAATSHGTSGANGLRYKLSRGMESWVLRRADALTCICAGIKNDLLKRGIAQERITIIPNAVDAQRFQQRVRRDRALEAKLKLQNHSVIGFVGSFYKYEGLPLLLQAMPEILRHNPDTKLLLVGGGQDAEYLQEIAQQMGLQEQVIFTGRVANDQVADYYSLMDMMCYPRLPMRLTETVTPLKPLEAMAQHKLVIASDVGGHRELIRDGETGILFKAGDAADLAKKILDMFARRNEWQGILLAGRKFIEQERTWEKSVAAYRGVYESLCRTGEC